MLQKPRTHDDDRCLCPWTGLAEYLEVCEHDGVDPVTATRAHLAVFVRESTTRPSRREANVVSIDSGAGLANATLQQRLVAVPLFYDFLIAEGLDRAGCCCRRI